MFPGQRRSVELSSQYLHLEPRFRSDGIHRKGTLQPITLTVKTRQGRRTVTHVTGLETFSVEIDEFAEELRKICAGSASGEFTIFASNF